MLENVRATARQASLRRRGGRVVYRGGLENRFGRKPNGGSNPSLSASLRWNEVRAKAGWFDNGRASCGSASQENLRVSVCEQQLDTYCDLGGGDWRCFRLPLVAGADSKTGRLCAGNARGTEEMFVADMGRTERFHRAHCHLHRVAGWFHRARGPDPVFYFLQTLVHAQPVVYHPDAFGPGKQGQGKHRETRQDLSLIHI